MRKLVGNGTFFEGPRWHDGRWWVSDFYSHRVLSYDPDGGDERVEATVATQPSGLGWGTDGALLIVSMIDRKLLRRPAGATSPDALEEAADLSGIATGFCNDMVVDGTGRAWVGNFGFDFFGGGEFATATLARVDPDGTVAAVAGELRFPNGSVVTPDGGTLIVGESAGACYTAFTINADGSLSDRRTWAELPGIGPDGCGLDAEGRIWCADAFGNRCVLVEEGGRIVNEIKAPDGLAVFACMLGGPDGTTLLMCAAPDAEPDKRSAANDAALYAVDVDAPRAGYP